MAKKQFYLKENWTIIAHPDCCVFEDISNPGNYCIMDWDKVSLMIISVEDHAFETENLMYGMKHKVNFFNKTITILHEPEDSSV
jgi:hypothetical protein